MGEGSEDGTSENGKENRACQGDNHGPSEEVVAQDIGCLVALLADQVTHENVATLCDAQTEQIDEHNHVVTVGSGSQCLVANLVDEEGDDHLRQTIGNVLAHGRYADVQQVSQFLPGDGTEIVQRETGDVYAEVDDGQQYHGDSATGGRGNGSTLDAQLRTAPVTEDERIVAQDVQYIDNARDYHWIDDLVSTAQRGGERQRQSLKERQGSRQSQINQSVVHQLRAESHE